MSAAGTGWLVGIDLGGTGSRVLCRDPAGRAEDRRREGGGIGTDPHTVRAAVSTAVDGAVELLAGRPVRAVAIAMARFSTYAELVPELRQLVSEKAGQVPTVFCADVVAGHVGTLQGGPGVTSAVGTGAITLAENEMGELSRIDGWGILLGDVGSGAWLGRAALASALQLHDRRRPSAAGGAELLTAAVQRFGPPTQWPGLLYRAPDPASVLASFAPTVLDLAAGGEPLAVELAEQAAEGLARSIAAGLALPDVPSRIGLAGGLMRNAFMVELLTGALPEGIEIVEEQEPTLSGALTLAERATETRPLPNDRRLIHWWHG